MADQPNSERLRRLEEDVNQRVRDAFVGLRDEVAGRLRRLSEQALEAVEELGGGEAPSVLGAADLEPLVRDAARDAESDAGRRAGDELLAAIAALDRAGSQGEVLSTLAREAARFAGRTALLLTRPSGAELWSAEGWSDAPSSLVFSYPEAAGWSPEDFGRGAAELAGDSLSELSGRLGADAPERAVLVPLVLRDRLAAVLYADGSDEEAPAGTPLQLLTWAASQALESLPFRQRAATPTLAGLGSEQPAGAALALWGSEGVAPASGGDERHHGAGRAVGIAAAGIAAAGLAAAGVAKVRRDRHEEEEAERAAVTETTAGEDAAATGSTAAESAASAEPAAPEALAAFDDIVLEEGPGPEAAAPPVSFDREPPEATAAGEVGWSFEDAAAAPVAAERAADEDAAEGERESSEETGAWGGDEAAPLGERSAAGFAFAPEAAPEAAPTPETAAPTETAVPTETAAPPDTASRPDLGADDETLIEDQTHPAGLPAPPSDVAAPAETAAVESADETYPGFATSAAPGGSVATPPVAPPPVAAPPRPAGAEVAPPPDLQGPGRAFAGRGEAPRDEEQARHDEARRLARLLVSEIRLYNEDEVEAGRRNGDVYERLKEDIDRSRQLYDERVDQRVREGTDYFYQELVRNLGGGDARVLGI